MNPSIAPGQTDLGQNMPLDSVYSQIFGNVSLQIQPSQTGEVSNTYGTIPYFSLEYAIFMDGLQAQTSPTNVLPGQNTGQQNIQGSITAEDAAGVTRYAQGNLSTS